MLGNGLKDQGLWGLPRPLRSTTLMDRSLVIQGLLALDLASEGARDGTTLSRSRCRADDGLRPALPRPDGLSRARNDMSS